MKFTNIPALPGVSRRRFVTGAASGALLMSTGLPVRAANATKTNPQVPELAGKVFNLSIGLQGVNFTGADRLATTVNQSLPAPVLRWKEGERVRINVTNNLKHMSSIHWHGIILPSNMDGVPGFSFDGIAPGETFTYEFDLNQSGTYWYHSHSGFQEQTGVYGAIVIEPKEADPVEYDRDYVVLLSDWSDEHPSDIYATLKKMGHYYNTRERTVGDLWNDISAKGVAATWKDRQMWNEMRMSDRDISDVTGMTYTYLMNGQTPDDNWTGLFKAGEKIRLRFINAGAMTLFDVRIPGLKMTVVASDGQNIQPVTVDEFRMGTAETYDVIVQPEADKAYTIFAQSIDRSGYACGRLTADLALTADVPDMDYAPVLGHMDMGMDHSAMGHGSMNHGSMDHSSMDHSSMNHEPVKQDSMDHSMHSDMDHSMHSGMNHSMTHDTGLAKAGMGSDAEIVHQKSENGPQTDMKSEMPVSGLDDPGIGLRDHDTRYGRRVLRYSDIKNLTPTLDRREPGREIQLHLTGNMHRYIWSMDGIPFADAEPLILNYGERVRITLVNDTMMTHPIHLHGLWSELETGDPEYIPRKHTILVQPGKKISYLVTADAEGRWAYHCHLLYHMAGMFREVRVVKAGADQHEMHSNHNMHGGH
ncbi:MAG: copper resistance system multicopper oxidase [Thalassolituus sp.]